MRSFEKLLLENKAWARETTKSDPEFFKRLASSQEPEFLWIGCSDSRVPANQITGTDPGEIFVQRNIANMVVHTDVNLLSVLDYAVTHLHVKHIIVCGHYGCGGVKAAMGNQDMGILNKWIRNIKDVYYSHKDELEAITTENERLNRLVELNVEQQVKNLSRISIVQRAWKNHQRPTLHGWVYGLNNGILKPIIDMDYTTKIEDIYTYDNL